MSPNAVWSFYFDLQYDLIYLLVIIYSKEITVQALHIIKPWILSTFFVFTEPPYSHPPLEGNVIINVCRVSPSPNHWEFFIKWNIIRMLCSWVKFSCTTKDCVGLIWFNCGCVLIRSDCWRFVFRCWPHCLNWALSSISLPSNHINIYHAGPIPRRKIRFWRNWGFVIYELVYIVIRNIKRSSIGISLQTSCCSKINRFYCCLCT